MRPIELPNATATVQPWGIETLLAETDAFTLKRLDYDAGKGGGFQYHMKKQESFHLVSGQAIVRYALDAHGGLANIVMMPGMTVTVPRGAPHQFVAITDCVVFEASEPVHNDRVNVAERYRMRVEPGTLPTTWTDAEIAAFEAGLV